MTPPTSIAVRARRREQRAAAERTILDAVEALVAERDFRDLTVEDVMASTGLTRTSFYRYFPDLEGVLRRWLDEFSVELRRTADRWLQDPTTGIEVGIEFVSLYQRFGPVLLAVDQAAGTGTDVGDAWRSLTSDFTDRYAQFIVDLCGQGRSTITYPLETARALVGMTGRYLLETYGRAPSVPVTVAAATLAEIWQRVLFSAGTLMPSSAEVHP